MKKRFFAICLSFVILATLVVVLVPSCTPSTQCIIIVNTKIDGSDWSGVVQYTLTGPGATAPTIINGTSVPSTHRNVDPGSWTCAYVSGGPGTFVNITPSSDQSVTTGGTITFTLNFARTTPLDHFKCYHAPRMPPDETVFLEDQFVAIDVSFNWTQWFCNPAEKVHEVVTPILHPSYHLTIYNIWYEEFDTLLEWWEVEVDNQFGTNQKLKVEGRPWFLAIPTQKLEPGDHEPPVGLDHFLVYRALPDPWEYVEDRYISLNDEFGDEDIVNVIMPYFFANPCRKTAGRSVTEIKDPEAHLVFYLISREDFDEDFEWNVVVDNQLGLQEFYVNHQAQLLAVPSEKLSAEKIESREPL